MTPSLRLAPVVVAALLSACSNPDTVVFVTNTSIGMAASMTPASASIGYDRTEAYIGPRYDNGAAPPVVGLLETGGTVFNPKISQIYATGAAAELATNLDSPAKSKELKGGRKLMAFGTHTTLGFKVGFSPEGTPDSVVLGYKRQEASIIPIGTICPNNAPSCDGKDKTDTYASVLATIDTSSKMLSLSGTGLDSRQFFATGLAAEQLAAYDEVRRAFTKVSKTTFSEAAINHAKEMDKRANTAWQTLQPAITDANGALVRDKLDQLIKKLSPPLSPAQTADLLGMSLSELKAELDFSVGLAEALATATTK